MSHLCDCNETEPRCSLRNVSLTPAVTVYVTVWRTSGVQTRSCVFFFSFYFTVHTAANKEGIFVAVWIDQFYIHHACTHHFLCKWTKRAFEQLQNVPGWQAPWLAKWKTYSCLSWCPFVEPDECRAIGALLDDANVTTSIIIGFDWTLFLSDFPCISCNSPLLVNGVWWGCTPPFTLWRRPAELLCDL